MAEAYPLWAELQALSDEPILHEVGLIYFGPEDCDEISSMIEGLEQLRVPFEPLNASEARRVMPRLQLESGEVGVFTPDAGWVHADRAVDASLRLAKRFGAELRFRVKAELSVLEAEFDAFVVCAGSWIREFVPVEVAVTKHTFAYFDGELEGPVWIEASADNAYGFPTEPESQAFKIGIHRGGVPIDADSEDRSPSEEAIDLAAEVASRRFGFESPRVVESKGCLYTSTTNDDFRLGRIGANGFYASACSGHGFKFGPWIGRLMADFVEGKDGPDRYPRFSAQ